MISNQAMATATDDEIAGACLLFSALCNRSRINILRVLATGPHSVSELTEKLRMRQAAMSQQLAVLRHTGIVATTRQGHSVFYSLVDERVTEIINAALKPQARTKCV